MKRDDKKGQFYLIAAMIIAIVMVGFFTISNYSKRTSFVNLYDLGEELKIESTQVLDYGAYQGFDESEIRTLIENFTETYSTYAGEGKNMYFIFGNASEIVVAGYQDTTSDILVHIGEGYSEETINMTIEEKDYQADKYSPDGEKVKITIEDINYQVDLKEQDYFYFIISQEIEGEKYFVAG